MYCTKNHHEENTSGWNHENFFTLMEYLFETSDKDPKVSPNQSPLTCGGLL